MASSSYCSIHLPGRVRCYCSELLLAFPWTESSKVANGGLHTARDASQRRQQARAKLPYTSPYTHTLVCVLVWITVYNTWATYKHMTVYVYGAEVYAL